MTNKQNKSNRRDFFKTSALATAGIVTVPLLHLNAIVPPSTQKSIYMIGPQEGFTPQVGTLLSTMTMMRTWVVSSVKELTTKELDFQIDDKSNSIGAMLLHLAATERYYQLNTFEGMEWGTWSDDIKKEWDVAMSLGEQGREKIKGHKIDYYLSKLETVRANTIKEFAKRDDAWLQESELFFEDKPTNNYCKWFHVCEHESNHNGQIKFIKKRFSF